VLVTTDQARRRHGTGRMVQNARAMSARATGDAHPEDADAEAA